MSGYTNTYGNRITTGRYPRESIQHKTRNNGKISISTHSAIHVLCIGALCYSTVRTISGLLHQLTAPERPLPRERTLREPLPD